MTAWSAQVQVQLGGFSLDAHVAGDAAPLALVGPNGSGKSTFLRALAGAVPVRAAEIVVGGRCLTSTTRGVTVPMEARRVGYVPQGYGLFPHLDVRDNVAFGRSTGPRKLPRRERRALAQRLLADLGIPHLAERRVGALSGGEQQRVALARALATDPALLLLDEPLAALDATTRRVVRRFLASRLRAFERPSVLVTHDVRDVIALQAEVCVLEAGRVVQQGTVAALRAAPATPFVAEFVAVGLDIDPAG